MSSTLKVPSEVARRYAAALIDSCNDARTLKSIEKDMKDLSAMLAGSADLGHFISSPLISETERDNALAALAKKAKS